MTHPILMHTRIKIITSTNTQLYFYNKYYLSTSVINSANFESIIRIFVFTLFFIQYTSSIQSKLKTFIQ